MTLFFRLAGLACVALMFASHAHAATDIDLSLPLTDEWKVGHKQETGNQRIMEIIPKTETVEKWTQMVTYLSTKGIKAKPIEVFNAMRTQFGKICTVVGVEEPRQFQVGGHDALLGSIGCGVSQNQPEGEYTTFLIITGKAGLYQVSRAWKGRQFTKDEIPLTSQLKAEWKSFFENVGICVAGKEKPECLNIPKQ